MDHLLLAYTAELFLAKLHCQDHPEVAIPQISPSIAARYDPEFLDIVRSVVDTLILAYNNPGKSKS